MRHVLGVVVSRKPDHGKGGPLHQETAYGIVRDDDEAAIIGALVTRKAVTALAAADIDSVRDRDLRTALQRATAPYRDDRGKVRNEAGYTRALKEFSEAPGVRGREQGVRRVRIGKVQKEFVVIKDRRSGSAYKALIGDVIAVNDERVTRYMSVHRLSPSNNVLYLAEHYEGGVLRQRHHDARDPFRWDYASIRGLQGRNARLVHIDILGDVHERPSNVGAAPQS